MPVDRWTHATGRIPEPAALQNNMTIALSRLAAQDPHTRLRIGIHQGDVVVQDEATSVVWGMPGFVAHAGLSGS